MVLSDPLKKKKKKPYPLVVWTSYILIPQTFYLHFNPLKFILK